MCALVWLTAVVGAEQPGKSVTKKTTNPVKSTAESLAAGQQIYEQKCSFCHGKDGSGAATGNPPSLTDTKWDHGSSDGAIFLSIRDGIGPAFRMASFKDKIPDRDIWHVVNYVRSLRAPRK